MCFRIYLIFVTCTLFCQKKKLAFRIKKNCCQTSLVWGWALPINRWSISKTGTRYLRVEITTKDHRDYSTSSANRCVNVTLVLQVQPIKSVQSLFGENEVDASPIKWRNAMLWYGVGVRGRLAPSIWLAEEVMKALGSALNLFKTSAMHLAGSRNIGLSYVFPCCNQLRSKFNIRKSSSPVHAVLKGRRQIFELSWNVDRHYPQCFKHKILVSDICFNAMTH